MKRKIFSALLFGACLMASTSAFVSCKDYDEDIQNLQAQIDANSKAIAEIQKLIQSGSVITSVEKTTGGVTVTLSNGNSFNITNGVDGKDGANGANGADGKDGSVITIGDNGNWFIDGKDTGMAAQGPKGDKGDQGDPGVPGADGEDAIITAHVWVLSDDLTKLVEYKDGVATGKTVSIESLIGNGNNQQPQVVVSALMDNETLVLYGVTGSATPVAISLSGTLKSLVYIPKLYFDGIETLVYPYLRDTVLLAHNPNANYPLNANANYRLAGKKVVSWSGHVPGVSCPAEIQSSIATVINYDFDYNEDSNCGVVGHNIIAPCPTGHNHTVFNYGPTWGVSYHMNPANAKVDWADVQAGRWNVLEPTIVNDHATTRAAASSLGVSVQRYLDNGEEVFGATNGVLTAGLRIAHPELLNHRPTHLDIQPGTSDGCGALNEGTTPNTVALQVNSPAEGDIITSDYALLYPEINYVEGLVWAKAPQYTERVQGSPRTNTSWGDEAPCSNHQGFGLDQNLKLHVWDTPQEALNDPDGAALDLFWDSATGINISQYLGIHYVKMDPVTLRSTMGLWKFGEEKEWGLHYEFNLVDYRIDANQTNDSHFVKWVDRDKCQIRAWNVKTDGTLDGSDSQSAIDRMPLVQVLVKRGDDVVLDGYILIHITKDVDPNLEIATYPIDLTTWDRCGEQLVYESQWAEFNKLVLTDALDNMMYETFLRQYEVDGTYDPTTETYEANQYLAFTDRGDATPLTAWNNNLNGKIGEIIVKKDLKGTTNTAWTWVISPAEAEQIRHDRLPDNASQITRYIRFKAIDPDSKYPFIYVKVTFELKHITGKDKFAEKNNNYWYSITDPTNAYMNGWDAILFDCYHPFDGGNISTFSNQIRISLIDGNTSTQGVNEETMDPNLAHKYYFVPGVTDVIDEYDGTRYYITAASGSSLLTNYDNGLTFSDRYDKVYCLYNNNLVENITGNNYHPHVYDVNTINVPGKSVLDSCAIDYNRGAFNNHILYGTTSLSSAAYTPIAKLNQATGEIELIKNSTCKAILNAVGYKPENGNINLEMRTKVGIISAHVCGNTQTEYEVAWAVPTEDGIFQTNWQRPVNIITKNEVTFDAKDNGTDIYLLDYVKLYDWRGCELAGATDDRGYMWGDHHWFWAYYMVDGVTVDLNPANVLTNMHQANATTFVPLNTVSTMVELYWIDGANTGKSSHNFGSFYPSIASYNYESNEAAIDAFMAANKEKFGHIKYANNSNNVSEFTVIIPVTYHYEWGDLRIPFELTIKMTAGHN